MNVRYDVPFVANPSDHCVPATIGMVLGYFMPETQLTLAQLDTLCGYVPGKGTWQTQSMLALADMGFALRWIEDFDWPQFALGPKAYLRKLIADPGVLQWQFDHSDLDLEAKRWDMYAKRKLPFEQRRGNADDIRQLLQEGYLVRLDVNSSPLAGVQGYDPHSVLVIGYDDAGVTLHNPDGMHGSKPNQQVSWGLLDQAWHEYGGSYSMYGFKKGSKK